MKQSPHQYPLFSDLIEAQKKSVLSFFEKGILEEFELFSYVQGKNIAMIFHGSKFFLQKPLFSFEYLVESQKTYSLSLFIPVEFQTWKDFDSGVFPQAQSRAKPVPLQSLHLGESPVTAKPMYVSRQEQASPIAGVRLAPEASPCEATRTSALQSQRHPQASGSIRSSAAALGKNFAQRLAPWIYCGEIPFMTERGNFLINGSARVLVNQIVRCPSVYFKVRIDQKNRRTYIGSFLSEYGSWLRLETDYKNRLWVRIDKSERFSIYALLRALGFPETFLKYQLKYYSFLIASQDEYNELKTRVRGTAQAQLRRGEARTKPTLPKGLEEGVTGAKLMSATPQAPAQASPLHGKAATNANVQASQSVATQRSFAAELRSAKPAQSPREASAERSSASVISNLPSEKVEEVSRHSQFHRDDSKSSSSQLTPHTAVQSIWKKCNPNRWNSLHGCYTFVYTKFFHPKKYSIGSVGRGRLNKRLIAHNQKPKAEIEHSRGTSFGLGVAQASQSRGLESGQGRNRGEADVRYAADPNAATNARATRSFAQRSYPNLRAGQGEAYAKQERSPNYTTDYAKSIQRQLYSNKTSKTVKDKKINRLPTLTPEDIFMALDILIRFHYGEGVLDDIDHLKNRRVRLPGELMQNQLRLALSRMTQASVDKLTNLVGTSLQSDGLDESSRNSIGAELSAMSANRPQSSDEAELRSASPQYLSSKAKNTSLAERSYPLEEPNKLSGDTSAKLHPTLIPRVSFAACLQTQVFSSTFKELFNTSQLSQYMDQTNPLAEITHKRRLSSLGPGGIAKDQAGVAVREIHPSHFGRICPIETPEGQNAGLVGSLATYCQLTSEGFLEAIYSRKPVKHDDLGRVAAQARAWKAGSPTAELRSGASLGKARAKPAGSAGFAPALLTPTLPSDPRSVNMSVTRIESRTKVSLPPNHQRPDWFIFQADSEDEVFISAEQYRLISGNLQKSVQAEDKDSFGPNFSYQSTPETKPMPSVASQRLSLRAGATGAKLMSATRGRAKPPERSYASAAELRRGGYALAHAKSARSQHQGPASPLRRSTIRRRNLFSSSKPKYTPIRYRQEFFRVNEALVEFFGVSPIQMISLATSLIPFLEHDDANRALMGSNMQRQAVPLMTTERAYVGTGLEVQAARDSTTLCCTQVSGKVSWIDANHVVFQGDGYLGVGDKNHPPKAYGIEDSRKNTSYHQTQWEYDLQKYWRSNQNTCIYQKPNYQHGAWVEKGRCIADGAASSYGEIALGKNIFVAYMPWEGFNFEDAIVINQRLVDEDIYTSIHIERYDIDVMDTEYGREILGRDLLNSRASNGIEASKSYSMEQAPDSEASHGFAEQGAGAASSPRYTNLCPQPLQGKGEATNLDARGIILPGTWVEEDDILVGKMTPIAPPKPTPEYRLLLAIFETKPLPFRDTSLRVPPGIQGRILECIVKYEPVRVSNEIIMEASRSNVTQASQNRGEARVQASQSRGESRAQASPLYNQEKTNHTKPEVLSSRLVESVQIFLVSKRKIQLGDKMSGRHGNKGIVSCILPPQDMPFVQDGSPLDIVLNPLGVPSRMNVGQVLECLFGFASKMLCENYRLIPFDEIYGEEASRGLVYKKLFEASKTTGYEWIFDPNHPGKTHIFDGRTGETFHQPVLVGYSYMLKLIHQVDEKMHARSTGPYSLITQQPLGGRAKHGGQRLGEMEVWACEGFGASAVLHEFLTLKSDDIDSRNTFLFHVMKRKNFGRKAEQRFHNKLTDRINALSVVTTEPYTAASHSSGDSQSRGEARAQASQSVAQASPLLPNQISQPTTVPESFRVLVHELQSLCLSVYFHPEFRLTYPSLLGWDGLFVLPSQSNN